MTRAAVCAAFLLLMAAGAGAQDKGKAKGKPAAAAPQPKAAKSAPAKRAKGKKTEEPVKPSRAEAPPLMAADDDGDVRKEGGTDVKAVEFTGLDIEGQLKTPQMLYFLNRLRAEFARPELPHRSFIPELSRSSKEKDL
jgi:hypothetical protein